MSNETTKKEPVRLTPAIILGHLENGLTRVEIQAKYGLSGADMKRMFQHPDLKGKKTKPAPGFVWAEDEDEDLNTNNSEREDVETAYEETQSLV